MQAVRFLTRLEGVALRGRPSQRLSAPFEPNVVRLTSARLHSR